MKGCRVGLVLLLGLALRPGPSAACVESTYQARVFEQTSGVLLYVEHHHEDFCAGVQRHSQVIYVGPDGDTLATKTLDFSRIQPDVVLDDRRTGYREGAVVRGDSIDMFRRFESGAEELRASIRPERLAAINVGVDHAVRVYWDLLEAGSQVEFDFAVPERLRCFHFRLRRLDESGQQLRLRIEPANWWLRWVVSRIDLTYDVTRRRLLWYEGITDMRDERGRRYRARIEFDYPTLLPPP
ncbi:MAG: hypothetical protein O2782_21105 [bacterium]|nr:hypothetical protein [bacterium]